MKKVWAPEKVSLTKLQINNKSVLFPVNNSNERRIHLHGGVQYIKYLK
jgi:hypothetical protein